MVPQPHRCCYEAPIEANRDWIEGMANDNSLDEGEVRLGWFVHKRGSSPLPAALKKENRRIILTIQISPTEGGEAIARWFTGRSINYSDDPEYSKYEYSPPDSFVFADALGKVGLFDCHRLGYKSLLGGAGEGHIRVGFTVFGAGGFEFSRPTHLRTFVPGMGDWIGVSSLDLERSHTAEGLDAEIKIETSAVDAIELTDGIHISTSWTSSWARSENRIVIEDPPFVESVIPKGASISEHLERHQTFLDLVDLAYWQATGYNRIQIHIEGDLDLGISKRWNEVSTEYVREQRNKHKDSLIPLFFFGEVGGAGFKKWETLKVETGRAIAPMLSLLDMKNTALGSQFIQSCIGLEGIGVHLLRIDGKDNKGTPLVQRLKRIVEDVGFGFSDDWAERASRLYNDTKHYDRNASPTPNDLWNTLQENSLMFRAWAMVQLGFDEDTIQDRIQYTNGAQQLVGVGQFYFKNYPKNTEV